MFELTQFYSHCFNKYKATSLANGGVENNDIDNEIRRLFSVIDSERRAIIASASPLKSLQYKLDELIWTDATEFIDLPDFPLHKKLAVVKGLHIKNRVFGTYRKIFNYIAPEIEWVNRTQKRPFRIVEIAGGEGFLSKTLFQMANKANLSVEITCSDIVEEYVKTLPAEKATNGNSLNFMQLNALNMQEITTDEYDIMLSLHSIHHFTPEQLALMFKEAIRVCRHGVLAVDGTRSAANQLFIVTPAALATLLTFNYAQIHDAGISARKMYPVQQLRSFARVACPTAEIEAGKLSLGLNYIKVTDNAR